jgi:tetratricopeptide (TPR) repeat protein
MILRVLTTLCLCLQVILSFGSVWTFMMSIAGQVPTAGLLQYPLGLAAFIGGFAILFPEFCAVGSVILMLTWGLLLLFKIWNDGNTFLEMSMLALAASIAVIHYNQIREIIRTKTLGDFPVFQETWWRRSIRYGLSMAMIIGAVGTLFYFFQKAGWGAHEERGVYALDHGMYGQAVVEFKEALRIAEAFPRSEWRVISALNQLGRAYLRLNEVQLAENTLRSAVNLGQRSLDANDRHYYLYFHSIDGLATTFSAQARYPEAEALYLQTVASTASLVPPSIPLGFVVLMECVRYGAKLLGDKTADVETEKQYKITLDLELGNQLGGLPSALDGLGKFYREQHQLKKAEDYSKRALFLKTKILASQFPDLGQRLLNTERLSDEQGKPLEGLALYEKFRPYLDHIDKGNRLALHESLNQIGLIYWTEGRSKEAEPLYLLSLAIKQSSVPEDTPAYAMTLTNLGLLYNMEGRYAEAEPRLLAALAIREKMLSPDHPDLAHSYNNLALLYDNLNQADKAAPLYEKALAIRQQALGPLHAKSILTLDLLANLYFKEAQYAKAEPLFVQLIHFKHQELGSNHSEVLTLTWKLAAIYGEQGKYAEAISYYEEMIPEIEQEFGPTHRTTLQVLSSYADILKRAGKPKEAEQILRRIRETESAGIPPPLHQSRQRTKRQVATL